MKIAIHDSPGSFSDHWIEYCKENNIDYKIVNAYNFDIVRQVEDCDAFMWHHHHGNYKDVLFAKQLLYSLQIAGKKVFPDFNTGWHFDDKLGQKYLLEAIGVSIVPTYAFYSKQAALEWVNKTTFPKVFKLRGGAGSMNVKLVKTPKEAIKMINRAFSKGFTQFDRWGSLNERIRKYKDGKDSLLSICKGIARLFISTDFSRMHCREKGYIYFQDFIPDNSFDTRIVVIGAEKAFGERRFVRKNDFRASGSGDFSYDGIDLGAVRIAFEVSKKLGLQSVALDFVTDSSNNPLIVEMSYGFGTDGIKNSLGYWDEQLHWHETTINIPAHLVEILMKG
ncbi:ATP-grasp domain-containing protein [Massilibacteroides vaginae]|uniref:ATP-grasp domain-containing protein n=1 Tax=Massilibacteroides vaginae TaxID=1673718 RepID=UPI000A1C823C|nr:hypothetical protein [Massilibacteroides vaginae]